MRRGQAAEPAGESPAPISSQFDEIAFLYDDVMVGVPYSTWVDYVERIVEYIGHRPRRILDLCCGTGTVANILAAKGYKVTGVDISPAMIEIAGRKARKSALPVEYRVANAADLSLHTTFDLVLCLFDSLNYILEASVLQVAFYRVSAHLERGGLFIFDMNTELALAGGLFDQNNIGSRGPVLYTWKSSYEPGSRICRIDMKFLNKRGGTTEEVKMVHYQRAYDNEEVSQMLHAAGLDTQAVYHAYSFRPATSKSDRVFFVARKR